MNFDRGKTVDQRVYPHLYDMQMAVDEMVEALPLHLVRWLRARKKWLRARELHLQQNPGLV